MKNSSNTAAKSKVRINEKRSSLSTTIDDDALHNNNKTNNIKQTRFIGGLYLL